MNCVSNGSKTSNKRGASNQPQDMWDFNGWRIPDTVSVDPFWSWMCVSIGWVSIPTTSKVQLPVLHFNCGKGISCNANTILESYNIISNMYITMYTHNIETQPKYSIIICNLCRTYHYHIYIYLRLHPGPFLLASGVTVEPMSQLKAYATAACVRWVTGHLCAIRATKRGKLRDQNLHQDCYKRRTSQQKQVCESWNFEILQEFDLLILNVF